MDYRVGSHIPDSEILKRFKDEDGETFLEVRGMENVLFRVTTGNQVYYKIEKELMEGEELSLVEDLSNIKPGIFPPPKATEDTRPELVGDDIDNPFLLEESATHEDGADTLANLVELNDKDEVEITELEEGDTVPKYLRNQCKRNTYGGYSLRFNRFLYLLDRGYRVDVKTPDAALSFQFDDEPSSMSTIMTTAPAEAKTVISEDSSNLDRETETRLEKGDILPEGLRSQCEEDISSVGGLRIMIGDCLYLLDASYRVMVKMKLSYSDEVPVSAPPPSTSAPEKEKPREIEPPLHQLTGKEIVSNVVKHFETALEKYNISADFFKESILGSHNREILIRAYQGDLTDLSDDTREATKQGVNTVLEEKGFSLFRAALLHELYINSTLTGRGENMKYFVTHIASITPDGSMKELSMPDELDREKQQETVQYFGSRAKVYPDKTEIIKRVFRSVRTHIFEEFEYLMAEGKNVGFNALLITRLYENTTRLDRGNGITMIRLIRDLLDYGKESKKSGV
jgi:hypothetical protein